MTRRRDELLRAGAAGMVLLTVVVGVPMALATLVGWPLPRSLPTWDAFRRALDSGDVADSLWLKAIACVVWAAWAQFTASVLVETRAAIRGRMAQRVPGVPASAQLAAARLVTTVAVVLAAFGSRPEPVVRSVPVVQVVAKTTALAPSPPTPAPPTVLAQPAGTAAATRTWVVGRRESLWSIAERTLGAGERYAEIFELNRGRPQPDGGALTRPDVIEPGWVLLLPADAAESSTAGDEADHTVVPGETLWEIAEESLGDGERSAELFDLNHGRPQPDGRALIDADLIRPGWVLHMPVNGSAHQPEPVPAPPALSDPATADPASATAAEPSDDGVDTVAPTTSAPEVDAHPNAKDAAHAATGDADGGIGIGVLAGGGLALGGVALTVDRLRRVQQRRRRSGRRVALPEPGSALEQAETRLRGIAAMDTAAAIDAVLRGLTERPTFATSARLTVACATAGAVVLRVANCLPPPEVGTVDDDGWRFALASVEPTMTPSAAPSLVALGADGHGEVLVDVESAGVLAIAGEGPEASRYVAGLAVSLATAPWSDDAEVVLVGVDVEVPLPWVVRLDSLAQALDMAESRSREVGAALRYAAVETTLAGRMAGITPEAWEPLVVVADAPLDDTTTARLVELSRQPNRGVAVVVRGEVAGIEWQAQLAPDGRLRVPAAGLDVDTSSLTREAVGASTELLLLACDTDDRAPSTTVAVAHGDDHTEPALADSASCVEPAAPTDVDREADVDVEAEADVDVEVRVLGDVEIVGRDGAPVVFERSKSAEAVVYLVLHPDGVTKDPLQFALWPDGENAEGTWHHTISKARRGLGDGADGAPLFPPVSTTGGIYRLGTRVGSDYARFAALVQAARRQTPREARALLERAMALVRGEPIMARGPGYAWRAGLAATIEAEIVDAAERLAELCLDEGDARACESAARRGLLASPYDERLYRLLMRAADAAGNSAGVHKVLQELAAKLELDVEPLDGVHPETVALFDELTARRGRVPA